MPLQVCSDEHYLFLYMWMNWVWTPVYDKGALCIPLVLSSIKAFPHRHRKQDGGSQLSRSISLPVKKIKSKVQKCKNFILKKKILYSHFKLIYISHICVYIQHIHLHIYLWYHPMICCQKTFKNYKKLPLMFNLLGRKMLL